MHKIVQFRICLIRDALQRLTCMVLRIRAAGFHAAFRTGSGTHAGRRNGTAGMAAYGSAGSADAIRIEMSDLHGHCLCGGGIVGRIDRDVHRARFLPVDRTVEIIECDGFLRKDRHVRIGKGEGHIIVIRRRQ